MVVCVCFRRLSPFPVTIQTNWVCRLSFLSTVEWNVDVVERRFLSRWIFLELQYLYVPT